MDDADRAALRECAEKAAAAVQQSAAAAAEVASLRSELAAARTALAAAAAAGAAQQQEAPGSPAADLDMLASPPAAAGAVADAWAFTAKLAGRA